MRAFILITLLATLAAAQHSGYSYNRATTHHSSGSRIASPAIIPQTQQLQQPAIEEYSKEFYTYSAPEEEFAIPQQEQSAPSVTKRNLQVVFIRAPEQPSLNHALQNIAQQSLKQQTAIYVLTKQPDLSQLTHSLQRESNHISHKPEVHFIKYRTPEDAQRAQQSIRAQYDSLGGSSSHNDEGVAPVLNFASQQSHQQAHQQQASVAPAAPSQTYLPIRF